jgi:hypothetical protein
LLSSVITLPVARNVPGAANDSVMMCAANDFRSIVSGGTTVDLPDQWELDDLVFYRLGGEKIIFSTSVWHNYPECDGPASVALVATEADTAIDWKVCSPSAPSGDFGDPWGLQLLDENGQVTFDSRWPFMEIVSVHTVSEAIMRDIIINGASHDITLPYAVPDPWICCPYHVSFQQNVGTVRPGIRRVNDTTLRIDRVGSPESSFDRRAFQGGLIIVAR